MAFLISIHPQNPQPRLVRQAIAIKHGRDPTGAIASMDIRASATIAELKATEAAIMEMVSSAELPLAVNDAVVA